MFSESMYKNLPAFCFLDIDLVLSFAYFVCNRNFKKKHVRLQPSMPDSTRLHAVLQLPSSRSLYLFIKSVKLRIASSLSLSLFLSLTMYYVFY
jgi:hypothetical protein